MRAKDTQEGPLRTSDRSFLWASIPRERWPLRYGLAAFAVVLAAIIRHELGPSFVSQPFTTFFPAMLLVALFAGAGPGIFATLLSGACATYFFMEPTGGFEAKKLADLVRLGMFTSIGVSVSALVEAMRKAREAAFAIERRLAQTRLRESELRLQLAVETAGVGVFEWNIPLNEMVCDSRMRRHWGLSDSAPVNYETLVAGIRAEDRTAAQSSWDAALDPLGDGKYIAEFRVIGAEDGAERWIAATGQTLFDEKGRAQRFVGASIDLSERKHVEEALKDADRCKDEFLATLAHELRNPLAPISNAVHVLRRSDGEDAEAKERRRALLTIMERQVSHLVRLVDDLLEIARISRGMIELRIERVDLAEILRAAVETSQPLIDAKRHRLTLDLPSEQMPLDADPVRLAQVFANLLNNAAKYTREGGRIFLKAERKGEEILVSVRDSGVGIPVEMLPKVFDLFTQVDRNLSHSGGGLGIGLALARGLVLLHGGRIDACSEGPDKGSIFVVWLPIAAESVTNASGEESGSVGQNSSLRIMVIDDDCDVADSFVWLLQTFGATVRAAYSGAAGLEAIPEFEPNLVFLDIGMPHMDGYETARLIRAQPGGKKLKLVALTGWGQKEDRQRALEAGFDQHLTKPTDLGTIEKLLASLEQG